MRMMMNMLLTTLLLGLAVTAAAGAGSCVGRCGQPYSRGQPCSCDSSCPKYKECCTDYQTVCNTAQSCQGRCGEAFSRGRACECDQQCVLYNTCCHDYQANCDASASASQSRRLQPLRAAASGKKNSKKSKKGSNSESEERYTARGPCPHNAGGLCDGDAGASGFLNPLRGSGYAAPSVPQQQGMSNPPVRMLPHPSAPQGPAPGSSPYNYPSLASGAPVGPSGPGGLGASVHSLLSHLGAALTQGQSGPAGSRPSTLQNIAQALGLSGVEGGSEGAGAGPFADVDLCSDTPIDGLTALSNGTILIFKGELFWSVDPVGGSVGGPLSITDTLGVPSPIDTVFTRCNCQGNTYIIKGDQYWRFDGNMMMEPGFPKPLTSEFPGVMGPITAALPVPATRSRPEAVHFFKNGDTMQKFTFPPGNTPSCSEKPRSALKRRPARQAGILSGIINIKVSLKGFPTPVTSALSMPNPQSQDGYKHFIFSGPLFFTVQISGDLPALADPDPSAGPQPLPVLGRSAAPASSANQAAGIANPPRPANSIRAWLNCPE